MGLQMGRLTLIALVLLSFGHLATSDRLLLQQNKQQLGQVPVTDPQLKPLYEQVKASAGAPRLFYQNLPSDRPAERIPGRNWWSSNYSVFAGYDKSVRVVGQGLEVGVVDMKLQWEEPLPGVTGTMMKWLFERLRDKAVVLPFDNNTYSMYTLLHPVDHIRFTGVHEGLPVTVGSNITFMENPNSGCSYQPNSRTEPWVCPANRQGFTNPGTPEAVWRRQQQVNATLTLTRLDKGGVEWHRQMEMPGFGPRTTVASQLTWSDSPGGLLLSGRRMVGVMAKGAVTTFETQPAQLVAQANEIVRVSYLDGYFNNNISAASHAFALNWAQRWTGLQEWLPAVFKQQMRKVGRAPY